MLLKTNDGEVSATLDVPLRPRAVLILAHGAGADYTHSHMHALAEAFNHADLAVMRFNFPFKEAGRNRVDSKDVSVAAIADAEQFVRREFDLPLFIGGHSFGGRMATHAVADGLVSCEGMLLCSFPLHSAGKPGVDRAEHLSAVDAPMLFLSGTRDALANTELMEGVVATLGKRHHLHWLDTADHSFKVLKRSRSVTTTVYEEVSAVAAQFVDKALG